MISLISLILAGSLSACMDVLRFRYDTSIFKSWKKQYWIDPSKSSMNKWKYVNGIKMERFLGSSTIFVFITDFWHFCKFLMLLLIMGSVVFYQPPLINWWADFLIFYCAFTVTFELFFSKFLIKKS